MSNFSLDFKFSGELCRYLMSNPTPLACNFATSILFNEAFRKDLLQKAENYVKDSFVNQENASKFLINILKKY